MLGIFLLRAHFLAVDNSLLLLTLGNASLLGSGQVASSLWALGYNRIIDCVSTEHSPLSGSSLSRSRPLWLTIVSFVSRLRAALVWQVILLPSDSLPPWLKKRYDSNSSRLCYTWNNPHNNSYPWVLLCAIQCAQYFPGIISTLNIPAVKVWHLHTPCIRHNVNALHVFTFNLYNSNKQVCTIVIPILHTAEETGSAKVKQFALSPPAIKGKANTWLNPGRFQSLQVSQPAAGLLAKP